MLPRRAAAERRPGAGRLHVGENQPCLSLDGLGNVAAFTGSHSDVIERQDGRCLGVDQLRFKVLAHIHDGALTALPKSQRHPCKAKVSVVLEVDCIERARGQNRRLGRTPVCRETDPVDHGVYPLPLVLDVGLESHVHATEEGRLLRAIRDDVAPLLRLDAGVEADAERTHFASPGRLQEPFRGEGVEQVDQRGEGQVVCPIRESHADVVRLDSGVLVAAHAVNLPRVVSLDVADAAGRERGLEVGAALLHCSIISDRTGLGHGEMRNHAHHEFSDPDVGFKK